MGDWDMVRGVLANKPQTAAEADREICDVLRLSDHNLRLHGEVTAHTQSFSTRGTQFDRESAPHLSHFNREIVTRTRHNLTGNHS